MKGRNPAGLIHLVVPATEVDVNVHPAKHEVRFRNSRDLHLLISDAVAGAMRSHQKDMQGRIFGRERGHDTTLVPPAPAAYAGQEASAFDFGSNDVEAQIPAAPAAAVPAKPQPQPFPAAGIYRPAAATPGRLAVAEPPPAAENAPPDPPRPASPGIAAPDQGMRHGLQIIGQLDDLYILCQSDEGLVVIDQHAAHERLLFEDLRRQFTHDRIASQNLLFPLTVELSLLQSRLLEQHLPELERMGFALRHFGGNSYVISGVPALAGKSPPQELLLDMLEQFGSESGHAERENRLDRILATMACRAAVKAGARLSTREIEALLDRMARADLFSHCPHGRPVWKIINRLEVRKWFHRA